MPLSRQQFDAMRDWIQERAQLLSCPGCGQKAWLIQNEMAFAPLIDPATGKVEDKRGYPLVAVNCKICGYTAFFNAVQIGIVPGQKPPAPRRPRKKAPTEE